MTLAVIHCRLNLDQWSRVLFSDESSFSVGQKVNDSSVLAKNFVNGTEFYGDTQSPMVSCRHRCHCRLHTNLETHGLPS